MKAESHNGQTCYFDEDHHQYFVGDQVLTSVTRFVAGFFPVFEREKIAKQFARKHNRRVDVVLAEWDAAGEKASKDGKLIHAYAECRVMGMATPFLTDDLNGYKVAVDNALAILNGKYQPMEPEKIIFSTSMGLAGTVDLPLNIKDSEDVLILDWKTSKEIKQENSFQTGLSPLIYLDDCNFNHYALQLNIYEAIYRAEGYFNGKTKFKKVIVHLIPDGSYKLYRIPDMQKEVEAMLAWI